MRSPPPSQAFPGCGEDNPPTLFRACPQAISQLFRALGPGKQPFKQRPQVKSSPSANNRQVLTLRNLAHRLARLPRIFARTYIAERIE